MASRSEEHTSELQSHHDLVCRLLLEKKKDRHHLQALKIDSRKDVEAVHADFQCATHFFAGLADAGEHDAVSLAAIGFFFNDTATTEIYTLSLHDALPIWAAPQSSLRHSPSTASVASAPVGNLDRKSTRLNSSHITISYAVFCLKKKK